MVETVEWGNMVSHEKDTGSLCMSQHNIGVGIVKAGDKLTPLEDYIVVGFQAFDSSGGGYVEDVISGGLMLFINPKHYVETVGTGLAVYSREKGVVYGEGFWGGVAKYSNEAIFNIGGNASTIWNHYFGAEQTSPFYTPLKQTYAGETDWVGTELHQVDSSSHKIRIEITNTFQGNTITAYDSELAGCAPWTYKGECKSCCTGTNYARFLINRPGIWTIKITPLAGGSCANPTYNETWTWEVEEPEDWKETPISTASTEITKIIQEAGLPIYISPAVLVGGLSLLGGLIIYKVLKKRNN